MATEMSASLSPQSSSATPHYAPAGAVHAPINYLAPMDAYFVSEESIERAANRFIKWRSGKPAGPAGPVTLGETNDQSGFIGLPEAREILGISNRTMYLWATQDKAPQGRPLEIIKDPISEHLYIREKDVHQLKRLIPKRGLQRGRRPQPALRPI